MPDIRIRRYALDDAAVLYEAVRESLAELIPWMPWCHPYYAMHESRAWLDSQVAAFEMGTAFEFAITASDGRYLGACGVNQIDKGNQRANIGYWVRSTATRGGVATEAVRLVRDWAFQQTTLQRLEILVAVGNVPSHRVAEKSGAIREGVLRSRLIHHGVARDATMFSFVRSAREG